MGTGAVKLTFDRRRRERRQRAERVEVTAGGEIGASTTSRRSARPGRLGAGGNRVSRWAGPDLLTAAFPRDGARQPKARGTVDPSRMPEARGPLKRVQCQAAREALPEAQHAEGRRRRQIRQAALTIAPGRSAPREPLSDGPLESAPRFGATAPRWRSRRGVVPTPNRGALSSSRGCSPSLSAGGRGASRTAAPGTGSSRAPRRHPDVSLSSRRLIGTFLAFGSPRCRTRPRARRA